MGELVERVVVLCLGVEGGGGLFDGLSRCPPGRSPVHGLDVLIQGVLERHRGGEQPLLQQQGDEPGRGLLGLVGRCGPPGGGVLVEQPEHLPLVLVEVDLDGPDAALRQAGAGLGQQPAQMRLQPPDHHRVPVAVRGGHALGEAVGVEQLQQRLERLGVAVVGGGGEEQPVLEVRGQLAHRPGAQRVLGVAAHRGGGDLMGLVHDQQVEGPGVDVRIGRQELPEPAHLGVELHPLHRHDDPGMRPERVDGHAPLAPKPPDVIGVDHLEAQPELLAHLGLPFAAQAGRADDQDLLHLVAQHQLLGDQTGLDGLAQADVVGDEHRHPGHGEGLDQGQELVVLDVDPGPEGGLEGRGVGRGHRAPAHRVEKGGERLGVVQPFRWVGQGGLGPDLGAGLHFPVDGERVGAALVVDGNELYCVMRGRHVDGQPVRRRHRIGGDDRLDHPEPIPHPNQVPLLRHSDGPRRLNKNHLPGYLSFLPAVPTATSSSSTASTTREIVDL